MRGDILIKELFFLLLMIGGHNIEEFLSLFHKRSYEVIDKTEGVTFCGTLCVLSFFSFLEHGFQRMFYRERRFYTSFCPFPQNRFFNGNFWEFFNSFYNTDF